MAIPVINPTTSILGFRQWLYWEYQPAATNQPYAWRASGLPPGMTIDAPAQYAVTGVAATDVITATGSGFSNGSKVVLASLVGGAGLTALTIYYIVAAAGTAFKLAATFGGAAINFTTDITGGYIGLLPTGLISGAGTVPGTFNVTLVATNADGDSEELIFPIGIEESSAFVNASMGVTFDLISNIVSSDFVVGGGRDSEGELTPILDVKENDDYLLIFRPQKAGVFIDMTLSSLKLGLKEYEPDDLVIIGGGATESTDFKKFGTGPNCYWVLPVKFESSALKAVFSNYEKDQGTEFKALAEIEFVEAAGIDGHNWAGIGPDTLRRSSRTFAINVARDLIRES